LLLFPANARKNKQDATKVFRKRDVTICPRIGRKGCPRIGRMGQWTREQLAVWGFGQDKRRIVSFFNIAKETLTRQDYFVSS